MRNNSTSQLSQTNVLTSARFSKTPVSNGTDIPLDAINIIRMPRVSANPPRLPAAFPAILVDGLCALFEAAALTEILPRE